MNASYQVARVETARGEVEYAAAGTGPMVLTLHGAMGGWDQASILWRTLGVPGYRKVALSRPGYLGTALALARSPEQQADLYAEVLTALGAATAVVMAISGGGPSAIHFALRHRARCQALVLVSTCGGRVTERMPLAYTLMRLFGRFGWFHRPIERQLRANPDAPAERSILDPELRAKTLADPEAGPLMRELNLSTGERFAKRLPGTFNDVAVTRSREYPLEQVAVPTLVVHGTVDRLVPFARHGQLLARRIPGARLAAAEGGDHVATFTHRAALRAQVAEFLREHAPVE